MHPCHELRATESTLTALKVLDGDDALRVSTTSRSPLVADGSLTGRPSLGAADFGTVTASLSAVHLLTLKIHTLSSLSYLSIKRRRRGRRMAWSSADTAPPCRAHRHCGSRGSSQSKLDKACSLHCSEEAHG
jgi:hypothetical protein